MKSFLIILVFYFTMLSASNLDRAANMKSCLIDNGIKSSDMGILREVGIPDSKSLKGIPEDKIACALACTFNNEKEEKDSINGFLREILKKDDQFSANQRKEMLEILNRCYIQAVGDDCKLLHCIKITKPPFVNLIIAVREKENKKNQEK